MTRTTKTLSLTLAFMFLGLSSATRAADAGKGSPAAAARADIQKTLGFVPQFFLKFPERALPGAWEEMKTLQLNPATALPGKSKELIGLAVAAQIPCHYCIYAHTELAKLDGASEEEVGEAVAMAATTRHWSTFINGIQTDEGKFRAEIGRIVGNVKQAAASHAPALKPIAVVDGQSALRDAMQTLGYVPEFIRQFPDEARGGAWRQFRDVQLSQTTAVAPKNKELMGLAVASQIPCRFCIIAHTEFAKLAGATDAEISETIAMASLTRDLSTMLNGMQVDEPQFHRDVDRIVKSATAAARRARTTAAR
jgi:AhpD family alkylhydroperoxidase